MNAISPRQYETMRRVAEGKDVSHDRPLESLRKRKLVSVGFDCTRLTFEGERALRKYTDDLNRLLLSIRT